jgi:hypothetical protein
MARRPASSSDEAGKPDSQRSEKALDQLHDLEIETIMLKARIMAAVGGERPVASKILLRRKPDRRLANGPLGPEGERRRRS